MQLKDCHVKQKIKLKKLIFIKYYLRINKNDNIKKNEFQEIRYSDEY